jgi:hypothetical protein
VERGPHPARALRPIDTVRERHRIHQVKAGFTQGVYWDGSDHRTTSSLTSRDNPCKPDGRSCGLVFPGPAAAEPAERNAARWAKSAPISQRHGQASSTGPVEIGRTASPVSLHGGDLRPRNPTEQVDLSDILAADSSNPNKIETPAHAGPAVPAPRSLCHPHYKWDGPRAQATSAQQRNGTRHHRSTTSRGSAPEHPAKVLGPDRPKTAPKAKSIPRWVYMWMISFGGSRIDRRSTASAVSRQALRHHTQSFPERSGHVAAG